MTYTPVFISTKSMIKAMETILRDNDLDDCPLHINDDYLGDTEGIDFILLVTEEGDKDAVPRLFLPHEPPFIWLNQPPHYLDESETKYKDYGFLLEAKTHF